MAISRKTPSSRNKPSQKSSGFKPDLEETSCVDTSNEIEEVAVSEPTIEPLPEPVPEPVIELTPPLEPPLPRVPAVRPPSIPLTPPIKKHPRNTPRFSTKK